MYCFRNGTPLRGEKFQATPSKQDLGTSYGFFSKFLTSTLFHGSGLWPITTLTTPTYGSVLNIENYMYLGGN